MSENVIQSWWQIVSRGLLHLLYPPCCHLCGLSLPDVDSPFCASCSDSLRPSTLPACPRCAAVVGPFTSTEEGCPGCKDERFAFDAVVRCGVYDGVLREAVLRLKHSSGELLAEMLGRFWANHASETLLRRRPDLLVPIPLHWRRRWSRGYNQSLALARGLSDVLGIPIDTKSLVRHRSTASQHVLEPAQRRQNMQSAFSVKRGISLAGKTLLLVDDVMTTGSTSHEAARVLKRAGSEVVVVAVLARAGRLAGQSLLDGM